MWIKSRRQIEFSYAYHECLSFQACNLKKKTLNAIAYVVFFLDSIHFYGHISIIFAFVCDLTIVCICIVCLFNEKYSIDLYFEIHGKIFSRITKQNSNKMFDPLASKVSILKLIFTKYSIIFIKTCVNVFFLCVLWLRFKKKFFFEI